MFYKVLEGVSVIEYGHSISGPFCAKMLADLGAEVIKIEEPNHGDNTRRQGPFIGDIPGLERSGLFSYLNMNKLGITLNIETTTGKKIFDELIKKADIFVENNSPKRMEELGINYEHVKQINPGIIMTSITPFGQTGPYRDYKGGELINVNMGGGGYAATMEDDINKEPIKYGAHIFTFQAGVSAVAVTLGALFQQCVIGSGQHLDVSEQESVVQNTWTAIAQYSYGKSIEHRTDRHISAPWHILPCKDGYIHHAMPQESEWRRFLEVMGNPDWGKNELFKDGGSRANYWDGLRPLLLAWTMKHTKEEIFRTCEENHLPVAAIYTAKDIMDSKQLAARNFMVEVEDRESNKLKYPGVPYQFSDIPRIEPSPAPLLGQHNENMYCGRLGYTKVDLVKLWEAGVI